MNQIKSFESIDCHVDVIQSLLLLFDSNIDDTKQKVKRFDKRNNF